MSLSEETNDVCPAPQKTAAFDPDRILTVALDICEGMLESGAEIHRVEDTAERICRAYGAERVEIFRLAGQHRDHRATFEQPAGIPLADEVREVGGEGDVEDRVGLGRLDLDRTLL